MKKSWVFALGLTGLAAISLHAQPAFQAELLTDPAGRTLYVFDKDQPGQSNCSGACLQAWPAYNADTSTGSASTLTEVARLSASGQWTWKQMPLYYFAGDAKPGDRSGDGSGGVWHVVKRGTVQGATTGAATGYAY